mgnify:CR=1 FL=1
MFGIVSLSNNIKLGFIGLAFISFTSCKSSSDKGGDYFYNYVDTHAEDHLYDALRYGIMTRPRSSIWDYNPAKQRTGFQASDPSFGY